MRVLSTLFILIFFFLPPGPAVAANREEAREAFGRGYDLFSQRQYYPAINYFKVAVQNSEYPLLDYSYYYSARAFKESKNFSEALVVYQIILDYFKDSVLIPQTRLEIAQSLSGLDKYEEAAQTLRQLIAAHPAHEISPQARFVLGLNLEKLGRFAEAAQVYQNLDLKHPDSDYAEKAIERLEELAKTAALQHYEAPAAAIYNQGIRYFTKKQYRKAREYFSRLTNGYQKSLVYDDALLMLGRVYLRQGNNSRAIKWLKKCAALNKDTLPEAMYYLGLTYYYQDKFASALSTMEELIEKFPRHHIADDALSFLADYSNQNNFQAEAIAFYGRLIKSSADPALKAEAIWQMGRIYYRENDFERAYQIFNQAKSSEKLSFWAAKAAEKANKKDEAAEAYRRTIELADHSYYAYRAREELKIKAGSVPESKNQKEVNLNAHGEKYQELLILGLEQEANQEAELLIEKTPLSKKEEAKVTLYQIAVNRGRYRKPIQFADKKIEEALLSRASVDPRLWRLSYPRGYWRYVEKFAKKYDLDPYLVYAVIREESRFEARALSRSRAHGLMQIIPPTGRRISRTIGIRYSRWKMYQPRVNIWMGTYYLSKLIRDFDGNLFLALAGYNGGPGRVSRWLKKQPTDFDLDEFIENIPLRETRNYVKKVIKSYYGYKRTHERG